MEVRARLRPQTPPGRVARTSTRPRACAPWRGPGVLGGGWKGVPTTTHAREKISQQDHGRAYKRKNTDTHKHIHTHLHAAELGFDGVLAVVDVGAVRLVHPD